MKEINRSVMLKKRNRLTSEEIKEKSEIIKDKLFSSQEYKKAKTIMFYVSFGKEVQTHNMIKEALETKKVVVPKVGEFEINACEINDFRELIPGKYRILEPVEEKEIDPEEIDLVIVPGVAFDKTNHRIGYGKGYYDKFLKKIKGKKIGLAFDLQILEIIPKNDWDIKLDEVITNK